MSREILDPPYERRPYQDGAIVATVAARESGKRSVMVVMATGLGKTLTMAETFREFGVGSGRTVGMFIAHRDELMRQAEAAFRRQIPNARIAYEKSARTAPARADIVLASIQSLKEERSDMVIDRFMNRLGIVVIDEAHRSAAASYRELHAMIRRKCPDAMIVGFTATPDRSDGVGLADLYEEVVYSYDVGPAIADGYLVPPVGYLIHTDVSVDGVRSKNGDFVPSSLQPVVNVEQRNRRVVHGYRELAGGQRAIAFAAGIDHACALADALTASGVRAVAVYGGKMSLAERRRHLAAFSAGEFDVLCGADLFIEGLDIPGIGAVILSRPTQSGIIYRQSTGRGLRPHESIARKLGGLPDAEARRALIAASPKPFCTIIDVVDVTRTKSIQTMPRLFGVPYRAPKTKDPDFLLVDELPEEPLSEPVTREVPEPEPDGPLAIAKVDVFDPTTHDVDVTTKAKFFAWYAVALATWRIEVPFQLIGRDAAGAVLPEFALAFARALAQKRPEPADAAMREVGAESTEEAVVVADLGWSDGKWSFAITEGDTVVVRGAEPALAPAIRRVEALLRARYPRAIEMLMRNTDWREKPPSRRQVLSLEFLGLPVPQTRGEANDALRAAAVRKPAPIATSA